GVPALVGPNGCGKSNVSDAVRWVLGEQRARVLRGNKMEEIIFQGSIGRKPTNVAEVSLYFENEQGVLPVPYNEVVVTRRLTRSGQSDYLINNNAVRLRDVQDLLRGTGLGSDAGVVIEARMIDRLLSDKAEERRSLFEEAAGIGLYRDRRSSTERRLDRTADDLQRLEDLISEIRTQVRSLARQKGKAERHKRFVEERFQIVMTLARHDFAAFDDKRKELRSTLDQLKERAPQLAERQQVLERERDQRIQERASAQVRRSELDRRVADLRVEIEKLEGDINLAAERLKYSNERRERAEEEKLEAENLGGRALREHEAAAEELNAARNQLESVQTELNLRSASEDESRSRVHGQRDKVRGLGDRLQELAERGRSLAGERKALESELGDLQSELSRAEERRAKAKAEQSDRKQIEKRAAREKQTQDDAAQRAATELERCRHAVASARETAAAVDIERRSVAQQAAQVEARLEALGELERKRVGLAPGARALMEARDIFGPGAVKGPLSDFLTISPDRAGAVERVLGDWLHAVVVDDANTVDEIRHWHKEHDPGPLVLLPCDVGPKTDGTVDPELSVEAAPPADVWVASFLGGISVPDATTHIKSNGAVFLVGSKEAGGLLSRRAELDQLTQQTHELSLRLTDLERKTGDTAATLAAAEAELTGVSHAFDEARQAQRDASARWEDAERDRLRAEREASDAGEAEDRLRARIEDREARLKEIAIAATQAEQERVQVESSLVEQKAHLEELERDQESAQEKRVHWQVEEAQMSAREQAARDRMERAAEAVSHHERQAQSLGEEIDSLGAETERLIAQQVEWKDALAERRIAIQEIESAGEGAARDVDSSEHTLQHTDDALEEVRQLRSDNLQQ
ncbi:MAG: hypothetical protein ACE5FJ_08035, partial [Gemmatimonadales bacterium]